MYQFELFGICATLSLIDIYEKTKTPSCLPTNKPKTIPNGTLSNKEVIDKPSKETILEIIQEAVELEIEFITESLPCNLIGMNMNLMKQYIQYVADRLLLMLGLDKVYKVENPFEWMELISVQGKTNFFEKRVGEYSNAANTKTEDNVFSLEGEF